MGDCKTCLPTLPVDGPLPLLSLCINTHNEGADLLHTVLSVRANYSGPLEVLVLDDAGTDDSATYPGNSASGVPELVSYQAAFPADFALKVIRTDERVGCGRAKSLLTASAKGDAILHMDGHCRVLRGSLDSLARLCAARPLIIAPGVTPLHCGKMDVPQSLPSLCPQCRGVLKGEREDDDAPTMLRCTAKQCNFEIKTNYKGGATCFGGRILISDKGCKVHPKWRPDNATSRRSATWYAVFMLGRKALERIGGWNEYPGGWGSQEIGLALRAWFADVPIYTTRDVVCGHRYQDDGVYKAWKSDLKARGVKHYETKRRETCANGMYAHGVVFGDKTLADVWTPFWRERYGEKRYAEGLAMLRTSNYEAQRAHFQAKCKRKTDAQFVEFFGALPKIVRPVSPDDVTAIVLHYKRPTNGQKCVDALKAHGFKHIWQWCNDVQWRYETDYSDERCMREHWFPYAKGDDDALPSGVTASVGVERVFYDSSNAATWARYCVAPLAETPYVMFVDDDVELTDAGVAALLQGAADYPDRNIGLIGVLFKPPYESYRQRQFYKAADIAEPVEVDMLWPKGQIMPRELPGIIGPASEPELWNHMRDAVGGTSGDDFVAVVAQAQAGFPPSLVVPSHGRPYVEHHSEGKEFALSKQGKRYTRKRRTFTHYRAGGWEPLEMRCAKEARGPITYAGELERAKRVDTRIRQRPVEHQRAFNLIAKNPPNVFVEIGSCDGGTLLTYAAACAFGSTIVAIDDGARYPARNRLKRVIAELQRCGHDAHWIRGDSHAPETRAALVKILAGRAIDALHIDGDHSLPGVTSDWKDYASLVGPDGIVLFHDINPTIKAARITPLWLKLVRRYESVDLSDTENLSFEGHMQLPLPFEHPKIHTTPGVGVIWPGKPRATK